MAKIIALEGIDGSGKTKQLELLYDYLSKKMKVLRLDFPVYSSYIGREIGALLNGEGEYTAMGLSPKSMALWFAMDRFETFRNIDTTRYDCLLLNRYVLSNAVYQSARAEDIVDFVMRLEHETLSLPKPDAYLYFRVDPKIAEANVLLKRTREYLEGKRQDVYEESRQLQRRVFEKYEECAASFDNIITIRSTDELSMLSPDIIAASAIEALKNNNLI